MEFWLTSNTVSELTIIWPSYSIHVPQNIVFNAYLLLYENLLSRLMFTFIYKNLCIRDYNKKKYKVKKVKLLCL